MLNEITPMRRSPLPFTLLTLSTLVGCSEKGVAPSDEHSPQLVLNELMADNATTVMDDDDEHEDWIEILNTGATEISLADLALADRVDANPPWNLGLDSLLAPGERILIWADGDNQGLHANFKLASGGEIVILQWQNGGGLIDSVQYPPLGEDESYARIPDGTGNWVRTDEPTPGESNS